MCGTDIWETLPISLPEKQLQKQQDHRSAIMPSPDTAVILTVNSVAEYEKGSDFASMPANMETLPMSLWNFAQEIHTGRIYTVLGKGTLVFIFFAGLGVLWSLITGYIIRRRKS